MYKSRYPYKKVQAAASGHWRQICATLAPQLGPAMEHIGRHGPCPVYGGRDGFRLFKDFEETGGGSSNRDGQFGNGFQLLCWIRGQDYTQRDVYMAMVDEVADVICPELAYRVTALSVTDKTYVGWIKQADVEPHRFDDPNLGPAFALTLLEESGTVRRFYTSQLERLMTQGGFHVGESVQVTQTLNPPGTKRKWGWSMEHVPMSRPMPLNQSTEETVYDRQRAPLTPAQISGAAQKVWANALALDEDDPRQKGLFAYFSCRGIHVDVGALNALDSIRFHPKLSYFDPASNRVLGYYPTIVLAIRRHDGEMVNLHRIYLDGLGHKAPVPQPKKMTALVEGQSVTGAAIPLLPAHSNVLAIAEGVETALAVATATHLPVWSCVSSTLLENFIPPKKVNCVLIYADKDRSKAGEQAALRLKQRLMASGLNVRIYVPEGPIPAGQKSLDWNDVLLNDGPQSLPRRAFFGI